MNVSISKYQQRLLFVIAIFLTLSSVAGFLHFGDLYYILLGFVGILLSFQLHSKIHLGMPGIIIFLIACGISLIVNDVPAYFKPFNRYLVYILMLFVVSPLFTNNSIGSIRSHLFYYSLDVLAIMSIGSFFAYFLGINLFVRKGIALEIGAGTFSGLMNHSMVLGPFSAISAIYILSIYLFEIKRKKRIILFCGVLACLGASFFAASRIALVGGLVGCVFVLFRFYQGKMTKTLLTLSLIIAVALTTFPIWGGVTEFVITKQNSNEEKGSALYSRERKITARTLEFASSPIFGIGFCSVDSRYDIVDYSNGRIEPGSSWLAIASMTGLFGLLAFIPICAIALKQAWKIKDKKKSCTLSAILVFYLIHLLAEGYIMAPRSFLNMFFWLLLGAINSEYIYGKQLNNSK